MDNDDLPVGRILPRREVLALLGTTGMMLLGGGRAAGSGTLACIVSPELTEGPYYVRDAGLNRSDIRADSVTGVARQGTELRLLLSVSQAGSSGCTPLAGAVIDIWHCDAEGIYSGVYDPSFGETGGENWLRGRQTTGETGSVAFTTIYPGWYPGRAVHIHFKVLSAEGYEFTSQLFFDDSLSAEVYGAEPYASKGLPDQRNSDDGIYNESGGQTLLPLSKSGAGYVGTYDIGLYNG